MKPGMVNEIQDKTSTPSGGTSTGASAAEEAPQRLNADANNQ